MFEEKVTKFDLSFTSVLISLLDKISQVILVKIYSLVEYPAEINTNYGIQPHLYIYKYIVFFLAGKRKLQRENFEHLAPT